MEKIKILIGCEESQIICKEFRKLGFEAYSNDLIECSGGHPEWHLQMDVFEAVKLINPTLAIFHPPCIFLSYAGMNNWYDNGRAMKRIKAAEFFMKLYEANIKYICVENPRGIMTKIFRKPDQEIHPYFFGESELKRTCLWLKNLPVLKYQLQDDLFNKKTACEKPKPLQIQINKKTGKIKKRYWTDATNNGNFMNGHKKSKSFESIAKAMAGQWGDFIVLQKQMCDGKN